VRAETQIVPRALFHDHGLSQHLLARKELVVVDPLAGDHEEIERHADAFGVWREKEK